MPLPTHCVPLDGEAGVCPDCAKALLARVAELEEAIRVLDATDIAHRHFELGDPAKAYSDLVSLVQ